jgi:hypothetical protein
MDDAQLEDLFIKETPERQKERLTDFEWPKLITATVIRP